MRFSWFFDGLGLGYKSGVGLESRSVLNRPITEPGFETRKEIEGMLAVVILGSVAALWLAWLDHSQVSAEFNATVGTERRHKGLRLWLIRFVLISSLFVIWGTIQSDGDARKLSASLNSTSNLLTQTVFDLNAAKKDLREKTRERTAQEKVVNLLNRISPTFLKDVENGKSPLFKGYLNSSQFDELQGLLGETEVRKYISLLPPESFIKSGDSLTVMGGGSTRTLVGFSINTNLLVTRR